MKHLKHLVAPQTYLIKEASKVDYKEMLKLTFADLNLKKVISISEREYQSHPRNPIRVLRFITTGPAFHEYIPKGHEEPFLRAFQKAPELEIFLRNYLKSVVEQIGSKIDFITKYFHKDNSISEAFAYKPLFRIFGQVNLSKKGKQIRAQIEEEIVSLESTLPHTLESNKEEAHRILRSIGSNIFLLSNIDFDILKQLDSEFLEINNHRAQLRCSAWVGCGTDLFDGAFDSAFDSLGCGGDFGGGCGGCGGGGCGGFGCGSI